MIEEIIEDIPLILVIFILALALIVSDLHIQQLEKENILLQIKCKGIK